MSDPMFPEHDPFSTPMATVMSSDLRSAQRAKLPTYCLVMFIVSLVFSVIRVPLTFLGFVGYMYMADRGFPTGNATGYLLEVISGAGMALFGVVGNIGLLCKKAWGLFVAYALVASVLLSFLAAFITASAMLERVVDPAERTGMLVGIVFAAMFRGGLFVAYLFALVKFSQWIKSHDPFLNRM